MSPMVFSEAQRIQLELCIQKPRQSWLSATAVRAPHHDPTNVKTGKLRLGCDDQASKDIC